MGNLKFAIALVFVYFVVIECKPTMYKYNSNKKLEPDLVPVSSTVIPLLIYKVSYGINVAPHELDDKIHRPQGPIPLLTSANYKKKNDSTTKQKDDISIVKEVSNKY